MPTDLRNMLSSDGALPDLMSCGALIDRRNIPSPDGALSDLEKKQEYLLKLLIVMQLLIYLKHWCSCRIEVFGKIIKLSSNCRHIR